LREAEAEIERLEDELEDDDGPDYEEAELDPTRN
jgi:hypothetical protein